MKKNIVKNKSSENKYKIFSGIKNSALVFILVLCFVVNMFSITSSAASVSFSLSAKTVTEGEKVTVTFSSTSAVAAVDATLQFDPSFLQYVSCSGGFGASPSVSGGTFHIVDYLSSGEDVVYSLSLTFTALKSGSTKVSASKIEVSDGNGDLMDVTGSPSADITINAKPTASSDNSLKSLSVKPGTLSPSFSSSKTSYTVSVANSVTSVAVSASVNHSAAKYTVSGNGKLSVGKNTVTVKVTAENGDVRNYVITVNRAAPPVEDKPTPEPPKPEVPKVVLKTSDGTELTPSEFEDSQIPAGFTKTEISVAEQTVTAVVFKETNVVALYLKPVNEESELKSGFYYYDSVTGSLAAVPILNGKAENYTVLNVTGDHIAPDGYVSETVTVNNMEFKAFVPEDDEAEVKSYILYAVNAKGEDGLYVYDILEETLQRYGIIAEKTEQEPEPQPQPPVVETPPEKEETPVYLKILFYGGIALSVVLLVVCSVLIIFYNKISKSYNKLLSAKKRAAIKRREKQQRILEEEETEIHVEDTSETVLTENIDDLLTAGEYDVEDED